MPPAIASTEQPSPLQGLGLQNSLLARRMQVSSISNLHAANGRNPRAGWQDNMHAGFTCKAGGISCFGCREIPVPVQVHLCRPGQRFLHMFTKRKHN